MNKLVVLFALFLTLNAFAQDHPNPETLQPGAKAVDFQLKGIDGKMYSLADFDDAKILVIIFSAPHCPTAQAYEDRIIDIQNDYKNKGVQVVMINPNSPECCLPRRKRLHRFGRFV